MQRLDGCFQWPDDSLICLSGKSSVEWVRIGHIVQDAMSRVGSRLELTAAGGSDDRRNRVILSISPGGIPREQGYLLVILDKGIELVGADSTGLFYGAMTLKQICRQFYGLGCLPCLRIEDWPDLPHRGVLIDISRDKVPSVKTLIALIDLLTEWKVNQLQLYTEHTFAYRNHREVWKTASPMTGEQILFLDAYCKERYIDLVPNQNSFGHMSRWLSLPAYRHLAEVSEVCDTKGDRMDPGTLCPLEPESLVLLDELYGELLPHFSCTQFNVGCDETLDLGKGRSKEKCEERGTGTVYMDFLLEIHRKVASRGKTMQFWGDMLLRFPESIRRLPADVIALVWGYEADHPFEEQCERFLEEGIPFMVCPGTSSWNSIVGRTDNVMANIRSAVHAARNKGACGVLVTDWGDNGHWQHLPVSYLGLAYGAAASWCLDENEKMDLPLALNLHIFNDASQVMGKIAYELGNLYQLCGDLAVNRSKLFDILFSVDEAMGTESPWDALSIENLENVRTRLDEIMLSLSEARMARTDAGQIMDEFRNSAGLLRHACHLGVARLEYGEIKDIPENTRHVLAVELEQLIMDFRRLWLARNRPGGLSDSIGRLRRILKLYALEPTMPGQSKDTTED